MLNVFELVNKCEKELINEFNKVDEICFLNSKKVLDAFQKNNLSESHFTTSTGYGYNDLGRDKIEDIFCDIFKVEKFLQI